jgi:hypothetical protein
VAAVFLSAVAEVNDVVVLNHGSIATACFCCQDAQPAFSLCFARLGMLQSVLGGKDEQESRVLGFSYKKNVEEIY